MRRNGFRPKILCFLCRWCGYSAADLAGTVRRHYPSSVRAIEVVCSGMVHPNWIVQSLLGGMDGVMIVGCRQGQCHYGHGSELARERSGMIEETLADLGLEPERFTAEFLSAAEADRFAEAVARMTETLERLGPNKRSPGTRLARPSPVYPVARQRLVYRLDGKNYYWDGCNYQDQASAQRAISRYLDRGFEAKLVPGAGGIFIYTRRQSRSGRDQDG